MADTDRDRLVADLGSLAADFDGEPNISTVTVECEGDVRDYVEEFGTWYDALEAASIEVDGRRPDVDEDALLDELERLASRLGRPPTEDDVDERGKYDVDYYGRLYGSYVLALEAAGIEPNTSQYNFAQVEPPDHIGPTENVQFLKENGPTSSSEMPHGSSVSDRKHGMWKFVLRAGKGGSDSAGGLPQAVYYLRDKHDPESVIRTFFSANSEMVKRKTQHAIVMSVRDHDPDWVEVAKDVLEELDDLTSDPRPDPSGSLVVEADDETLSDALEKTVVAPSSDVEAIDDVDASTGYVWGLAEDDERLWSQTQPGDVVLAAMDDRVYAFRVEQRVRDWNATTDLWAEYEDGVRVAGPDRPWPYLLTGTNGEVVEFGISEFWRLVSVERSGGTIQYVDRDAIGDLDEEYDEWWKLGESEVEPPMTSSTTAAVGDDDGGSETTLTSTDTTDVQTRPGDDDEIAEVDAAVAALASNHDGFSIDAAVEQHLKRAVDGIEPRSDTATGPTTNPIVLDLTTIQWALLDALCGDDGDFESVDAFVEDALRSELDVPDTDREISITVDEATATALEWVSEKRETTPEKVVRRQIHEVFSSERPDQV